MQHKVFEWRNPQDFSPAYYFEILREGDQINTDAILLESDSMSPSIEENRYSYIALDPRIVVRAKNNGIMVVDSFYHLEESIRKAQKSLDYEPGIVPYGAPSLSHGGCVGYLSYDAKNWFVENSSGKKLQTKAQDDQQFEDMYLIFPQTILAFDHKKKEVHVTTFGDDESTMLQISNTLTTKVLQKTSPYQKKRDGRDTPKNIECTPNMTKEEYYEMVWRAKKYIGGGDAYQIKVSQRFDIRLNDYSWEVYKRLRKINPSPFSAYLDLDGIEMVSCSPEEILRVRKPQVGATHILTRPIGGTYPRGRGRLMDWIQTRRILDDPKERAEHTMLVDLLRNDIGKVATLGSVRFDTSPTLETYAHLHHLVTTVEGTLRDGNTSIDALRSVFPGGTITGCPKIRSMELIDELEPTARGPYTGSIGFITFRDEAQWNIIIRTLLYNAQTHKGYLQVGGGIVDNSDVVREWHETLWKAKAILDAL
jgi:para-aminobenzoate synthetase component I